MKYQFEKTDTFGGEANYSWVERVVVDVPDDTPPPLVRALARHWAGWAGRRIVFDYYGDAQTLRPRGMCQVLFITEHHEPETIAPTNEQNKAMLAEWAGRRDEEGPKFGPDVEIR